MVTSKQVQDTQRRKKLKAIEAFGGKCQICGYNRCPNALEFHHVGEKKEKPSYIIMRWSWERAKKELEKCVLICSNCHREAHYEHRDLEYVRLGKPWLSVECKNCKNVFETKDKTQVFCSRLCKVVGLSKPWLSVTCQQCKCLFETKKKSQVYCSDVCREVGTRKVQRPTKEELARLIQELPWVRIGKMFGVSDNAVRKWARKYELLV